jgi:hypothetical protein
LDLNQHHKSILKIRTPEIIKPPDKNYSYLY